MNTSESNQADAVEQPDHPGPKLHAPLTRAVPYSAKEYKVVALRDCPLPTVLCGKESFDLVISDWFRGGRPEGPSLVKAMRGQGICTPVLFYFFAPDTDLFRSIVAEAKDLQAVGATSSPRELLRWTFAELVRASLRDRRTRLGSGEAVQV